MEIDPAGIFINRRAMNTIPNYKIVDNGHYSQKLDIAFIAEGYANNQMDKFKSDVKRFADFCSPNLRLTNWLKVSTSGQWHRSRMG